jgi:putative ABC transport system permease protein
MGAMKISYLSLFFYLLLLVIPIGILVYLKLKIVRSLVVSVLRMLLQLAFVGLYLEYIFKWDNPLINGLWILVMILVANQSVLRQSNLKFRTFFVFTLLAFLITVIFSFITFLIVFDIRTFISARYIIPIGGMVLGNMLRGNIVSLERFYHDLIQREEEYIYYISLGASQWEALLPFTREALKSALSPYLATLATMGLVSLPGMMTGQILGGASPAVAIQYQVMIMIAIFVSSALAAFLALLFSLIPAIDACGRIRKNLFLDSHKRKKH